MLQWVKSVHVHVFVFSAVSLPGDGDQRDIPAEDCQGRRGRGDAWHQSTGGHNWVHQTGVVGEDGWMLTSSSTASVSPRNTSDRLKNSILADHENANLEDMLVYQPPPGKWQPPHTLCRLQVFQSKDAPNKTTTPEEFIRMTKGITIATAKAVAAGNSARQEDIIHTANLSRKAISDMLTTCKVPFFPLLPIGMWIFFFIHITEKKASCWIWSVCVSVLQQAAYHPEVSEEVKNRALMFGSECTTGYIDLLEHVLLVG